MIDDGKWLTKTISVVWTGIRSSRIQWLEFWAIPMGVCQSGSPTSKSWSYFLLISFIRIYTGLQSREDSPVKTRVVCDSPRLTANPFRDWNSYRYPVENQYAQPVPSGLKHS